MKENTLLKIAMVCSLAGIAVLYFVSTKIDVKNYNPIKLNENIGDDVKLQGTIAKMTDTGNVVFIEINQQNPATIVLFTEDDNLKLKNGDSVEISGKVQEYNGKNEIIANRIRVIK